jgi:hypothetical protein
MPTARRVILFMLLLAGLEGFAGRSARAQGWDYGRQMFGFAQYSPSTGWSSYYHPGDGRRGVYYVDAGNGNYYGDPKARPLAPFGAGIAATHRGQFPGRRRIGAWHR